MGKRRPIKNNENLIQLSIDHFFCSGKLTGYKTKQSTFRKPEIKQMKKALDTIDLDSDEEKKPVANVKIQLSKSPPLSLKPKQRTPNIVQSDNNLFNVLKETNHLKEGLNGDNSIEKTKNVSESDVTVINNDSDESDTNELIDQDVTLIDENCIGNSKLTIMSNNNIQMKSSKDSKTLPTIPAKYKIIDDNLETVQKLNSEILDTNGDSPNSKIHKIDAIVGHFSKIYDILDGPTVKIENVEIKTEIKSEIKTEINDVNMDTQIISDVNENNSQDSIKEEDIKNEEDIKEEITFSQERITGVTIEKSEMNYDHLQDERLNLFYKIVRFIMKAPNLCNNLPNENIEILRNLLNLPNDYQFILYKLYVRQEKWQRLLQFLEEIKITMDESSITDMMNTLLANDFIITDYSTEQPVDLLFNLLREEVKVIFKDYNLKSKKTTKPDLINAILKHCSTQMTLTGTASSQSILHNKIRKIMGPCLKLTKKLKSALYQLHLLYSFSNNIPKTSDLYFEISEIENGNINLPNFTCDNFNIFKNKDEFLKFSIAREYFDQYSIQHEKKDLELMWDIATTSFAYFKVTLESKLEYQPKFLIYYTAGNVLCTIITQACEDFANKRPEIVRKWLRTMLCQKLYGTKKRGTWYNLLALIVENQEHDIDTAAQYLIEGLTDPSVTLIDLHNLSHRGLKLINRKTNCISDECLKDILYCTLLKTPDSKYPFPFSLTEATAERTTKTGSSKLFKKSDENGDTYLRVETIAIDYYKTLNYPNGVHCEGSLIVSTLFFLFWDIIFDDNIPGAFITEIQRIPLDFYSSCFYERRKTVIDERLENISSKWEEAEIFYVINENINKYSTCSTIFSKYYAENSNVIYDMIACVGRKILAKIFDRIIKNFRFQSGMPDLFVWNSNTKKYKFVEVKSENDRLSMKQKLWLKYLLDIGAQAEICYVNSKGSRVRSTIKSLKKTITFE